MPKKPSKKIQETFATIDTLADALIGALDALDSVSVTFSPLTVKRCERLLADKRSTLTAPFEALNAVKRLRKDSIVVKAKAHLLSATALFCRTMDNLLLDVAHQLDPSIGLLQVLRNFAVSGTTANLLYPASTLLPVVSRFFVTPQMRYDVDLLHRLSEAPSARENTGLLSWPDKQGRQDTAFVYVPEYYDECRPWPLVVALHPAGGHGKNFIWYWLREARSFGAILIVPTACERNWSFKKEGNPDRENLNHLLAQARENWHLDEKRCLLTGTAEGGTFSYFAGLDKEAVFTHLAPFSANFHPRLLATSAQSRLHRFPIHITHGLMDWAVPVSTARVARIDLKIFGARPVWQAVPGAHCCHPRRVNADVMRWFLSKETLPDE